MSDLSVSIAGEEFLLSPYKACFWGRRSTLFLSDLHLGKAGHFRKHGVPVSRKVHIADLQNLALLIHRYQPSRVLLLGDLFHSDENAEWADFVQFIDQYDAIDFMLVQGNHDILKSYPSKLKVVQVLEDRPFSFTHMQTDSELYNISGHIHPGISIRGRARQGVTTPCFLFSTTHAIMPAFGQFTGIKKIKPSKEDRIYAVTDSAVIKLR